MGCNASTVAWNARRERRWLLAELVQRIRLMSVPASSTAITSSTPSGSVHNEVAAASTYRNRGQRWTTPRVADGVHAGIGQRAQKISALYTLPSLSTASQHMMNEVRFQRERISGELVNHRAADVSQAGTNPAAHQIPSPVLPPMCRCWHRHGWRWARKYQSSPGYRRYRRWPSTTPWRRCTAHGIRLQRLR